MSGLRAALGVLGALLAIAACTSRLDLETPHAFPCSLDGGVLGREQCPQAWRCGLEGYCHDISVGADYLCRSEADCEQGWHCGVEGRCYDLSTAAAVPCRADGGDCAPGWRCGLDQLCHDTDAGAPYLCQGDEDCEQGWRCGPEGSCLDAVEEAIGVTPAPGALEATRLGPLLPPVESGRQLGIGAPSCRLDELDGGCSVSQSVSALGDGRLHLATYAPHGHPRAGAGRRVYLDYGSAPVAGAEATAVVGNTGFALTDGGTLVKVTVASGAPQVATLAFPLGAGAQLRSTHDGTDGILIAFKGTEYVLVDPDTSTPSAKLSLPGAPTIHDLFAQGDPSDVWLYAATSAGLFIAPRKPSGFYVSGTDFTGATPNWKPFESASLDHASCSGTGGAIPLALSGGQHSGFIYVETAGTDVTDPGRRLVQIYELTSNPPMVSNCSGWGIDGPRAVCKGCPSGTMAFGYHPGINGNLAAHHVYCVGSASDGGTVESEYRIAVGDLKTDGSCQFTLRAGPARLVRSEASEAHDAYVDPDGNLTANCNAYSGENPICEALNHFPSQAIAGRSGSGLFSNLVAAEVSGGWSRTPANFGELCAPVRGRPTWALAMVPAGGLAIFDYGPRLRDQAAPLVVATLQDTLDFKPSGPGSRRCAFEADGRPQFQAEVVKTRTGTDLIVVAGTERVWAAEVPAAPPIELLIRDQPLLNGEITALAMVAPDPSGTDFASGYLVMNQRLFHLRAATPARWSTTEVDPGIPLDLLEVWAEGEHGRVVLEDGTVITLPSRVPVSEPLPALAVPRDFAQVCGRGYALTSAGLYRLVRPADLKLARWAGVNLDPTAFGRDFTVLPGDVRLHAEGDELVLWRRTGQLVRLRDTTCAE